MDLMFKGERVPSMTLPISSCLIVDKDSGGGKLLGIGWLPYPEQIITYCKLGKYTPSDIWCKVAIKCANLAPREKPFKEKEEKIFIFLNYENILLYK